MTDAAQQSPLPDAANDDPPGTERLHGKLYMTDTKGRLVPREVVATTDLLMDEVVRKIGGYALELSKQIARFRQHTADDVYSFLALLAQEYGVVRGGPKGNVTLMTFDGLQKITVKTADKVVFGPELQAAKALVDECLNEWSADSNAELRTLVQGAFNVDKAGEVSPARMFFLLRHRIEDPRWVKAMAAVRESIRPVGTKEYFNFYRRPTQTAPWSAITIDLAAA